MTAKYFAKIDVGKELEERILELQESEQEDSATVQTGLFNLIVHHLDNYMMNDLHTQHVTAHIYHDDISRLDVSAVSPEGIKARYVCKFSRNNSSGMHLTLRLSSNKTPVDGMKGELMELLKQACTDYALGIRHQMSLLAHQ